MTFIKINLPISGCINIWQVRFITCTKKCNNIALQVAVQAEQVYQFETDDDTLYISADNWQQERAGLLAGERLNMQLHRLEKTFIENNLRHHEINQAFSLALLDPFALLRLKQTGACTLIIPEMAYHVITWDK